MDIVIILMSLSCIILFSYRIRLVRDFLTNLKYAKRNEFINFDHLFHIEDALNIVAGVLVCITTVRLWKLLRFAQIFLKMERIILYSIVPLMALFLCQVVLILAFSVSGYLLFGNQSFYFKGIWVSVCSLFYISLNLYKRFDYSVLSRTRGLLGDVYYILFMFTTFTIYTLYVTAIIMGCEMSDKYFSTKKQEYTMQDLLKEEFRSFADLVKIRIKKERLRAGGDNETAKVYQISLEKLNVMRLIALAVLRKQKHTDFDLMAAIILKMRALENGDEQNVKFLITSEGLVEKRKLMEMERIVRILTGSQEKQKVRDASSCIESMRRINKSLNVMLNIVKHINVINK